MRQSVCAVILLALCPALAAQSGTSWPAAPRPTAAISGLLPRALFPDPRLASTSLTARLRLSDPPRHRPRNTLLGGVIGASAGLVTCTIISNLVKDSGTGFSTCTTSGYLGFGLGGFAVGAVIGWLLK